MGKDCGNVSIPPMSIHTSSPVIAVLRAAYGDSLLEIVGTPITNRDEIVASIERLDAAIAEAGREAAQRFGFEYPTDLESIVLASWRACKQRETNA
jgi:hypothetical protein